MHVDKLYELVRRENAILWAGSGLSLYAGYPNGQRLNEIIYNSLTPAEKSEIPAEMSLMDMTEQYVRLKGGSRITKFNSEKRIFEEAVIKDMA